VIGLVALPYPFHLQVQEETLHHGIVPAISLAAHAADDTVLVQQRLVSGSTGARQRNVPTGALA
jgi:hypothetical protein